MPISGRSLPQSPAHLSSLTSSSFRSYLNEVQSVASRRLERAERSATPHFPERDFWTIFGEDLADPLFLRIPY